MDAELTRGIELFNQAEYFRAHEAIEEVWRRETDPALRRLYQGLIQVAVGLVHLQRGNRRGARTLIDAGIAKLETLDPRCGGIDLGGFVPAVRSCRESLGPAGAGEPCPFDWTLVPRLGVIS